MWVLFLYSFFAFLKQKKIIFLLTFSLARFVDLIIPQRSGGRKVRPPHRQKFEKCDARKVPQQDMNRGVRTLPFFMPLFNSMERFMLSVCGDAVNDKTDA